MDLNHSLWQTLEGGYKQIYDPSAALKQLGEAKDSESEGKAFAELWENLHHQGDVGTASFAALVSLVNICITKKSLDWNYIGLCLVIEQNRGVGNNPEIPSDFKLEYSAALSSFEDFLLQNFKRMNDPTSVRLALSFLATTHGQLELGHAIEEFDNRNL